MYAAPFANPAFAAIAQNARSPLTRGLASLAMTVAVWEMRAATRRALKDIDPALLPDIGLTTAEVLRECEKPFWVA